MNTKAKRKPPKKYPFLQKEFCGRLFTLDAEFSIRQAIGQVVEKLLKPNRLDVIGRLGTKDQLVETSFSNLPEAFSDSKEDLVMFIAQGALQLEVGVLWFPPAVFEAFESPRARLELTLGFPSGWSFQNAEGLFRSAIQLLRPLWGELNRLAVTKFPTLCTLSGHHYCVPHLGTMNYFGPEYCEFFGGIGRIKSAGFARVELLSEGLLTSLDAHSTPEAYKLLREEIEARLALPDTFDPNATIDLPRFRR